MKRAKDAQIKKQQRQNSKLFESSKSEEIEEERDQSLKNEDSCSRELADISELSMIHENDSEENKED